MPPPLFAVLLVCTGNICRSPLAERLGRAYLDETLGEEAAQVQLNSAGTRAVVDSSMHPDSALVLKGFGGEPDGFTARQLVDGMLMHADLVLTMTRGHRTEVLALAPRALARTFTLREAADLVGIIADDVELPGVNLPDRARSLVKEMATVRPRREGGSGDDVADPIGKPLDAHQEAGEAIVESLLPVLDRIVRLADSKPDA